MLILGIALTSCSKDKDKPKPSEFTYENVKYELDHGFLLYEEQVDSNSHLFTLSLLSQGIIFDTINEGMGIGDLVTFEVFSSSTTELNSGTYMSAGTSAPGTFEFGAFVINANFSNETFDKIGYIDSGYIDIDKSGDKYKITFDCFDRHDKSVKGYYEGSLEYFNYGNYKSQALNERKKNLISEQWPKTIRK